MQISVVQVYNLKIVDLKVYSSLNMHDNYYITVVFLLYCTSIFSKIITFFD